MSDLEKYNKLLNHQEDIPDDQISEFLKKSGAAKVPSGKSKKAIWDKISETIEEEDSREKAPIKIWRLVGIAASIAVIATFSILFFNQPAKPIELSTSLSETKQEVLPDGSKVILNAHSSLSYSADWNRELTLTGEAFFEVTEGEKFLVKTDFGTVQVLGTSFNVFARNGDFEVACKTGKVKVSIPNKSFEESIEPGEIISMKEDSVRRINRLPELMGKWQAGEFYFNHQLIGEVLEEIQRQFNIEIEFDSSNKQEFSGYFTNKNLENALDMVCLPLGLEYQKTGKNTFAITKSAQ